MDLSYISEGMPVIGKVLLALVVLFLFLSYIFLVVLPGSKKMKKNIKKFIRDLLK